jgi:simple sugar transport system permease protein
VLSIGGSVMMLAVQGKPPLEAVRILWDGAFGASYSIEDTVLKSVPIYLCALGVAFTFRMQVWNIGAEGQFALGAIGATWAAMNFPDQPMLVLLPLMFLCSAVAGGFWAFIPAILKTRLKVNEIISTLMLNYIGILFLDYLVYGSWKDKASHGFPLTPVFSDAAIIPGIGGSRLHWGLALCVVAGVVFWAIMRFTRLGYELKASGSGPKPSRYARMPYNFLVCLVMVVCGILAGWAGLIETSAALNRLQPSVMAGYGFTAIVVAWLANLSPLWIALCSFLLAALRVGVENLQLLLQVPAAFGGILEGMILLTVLAARFFVNYRLVISRR